MLICFLAWAGTSYQTLRSRVSHTISAWRSLSLQQRPSNVRPESHKCEVQLRDMARPPP
jgi:hypothetical protein